LSGCKKGTQLRLLKKSNETDLLLKMQFTQAPSYHWPMQPLAARANKVQRNAVSIAQPRYCFDKSQMIFVAVRN
jgi:hypothetical protein